MKTIQKITLHYFSGTGNAKNTCHWIMDEGKKFNIDVELIDIGHLSNRKNIKHDTDATIGFVGPTHGFNFPPIMLHYIFRFPRGKNKVLIMNTRAGMKLGKLFLPGLSGLTQILAALILLIKGYSIKAMKPVDLPSNWISLHPGIKPSVVDSIYKKRELEIRHFAQKILAGKSCYRALYDILQDLLISPISIAYYAIGRFILAKTFIASSDCTKCKLCKNQCPVQAIKWVDNRPFWNHKCESCMHCMNICPTEAIETAHGFIFAFAFIIDIFVLVKFYQWTNVMYYLNNIMPPYISKFVQIVISSAIMFVLLLPMYRLMHLFLRYKWFERIIIYSSLTKYKFWRRFKIRNSAKQQ